MSALYAWSDDRAGHFEVTSSVVRPGVENGPYFKCKKQTVRPPFGSHGVTRLRLERRSPSPSGYAGEQTAQGVLESAAGCPDGVVPD